MENLRKLKALIYHSMVFSCMFDRIAETINQHQSGTKIDVYPFLWGTPAESFIFFSSKERGVKLRLDVRTFICAASSVTATVSFFFVEILILLFPDQIFMQNSFGNEFLIVSLDSCYHSEWFWYKIHWNLLSKIRLQN